MTALVQSYPQQSTTVTMLQTRPSSASGILQTTAQSQGHHQYPSSSSQMHLNGYHGISGVGQTTYRGQTSMAPGAPYPFVSASGLSINNFRPQHKADLRASSAPVIPTIPTLDAGQAGGRSRYPAPASISTSSSSSSELSTGTHQSMIRDDSAITLTTWSATRGPRPQPTVVTSTSAANLPAPNPSTPTKAPPDRYRRPVPRRSETAGSTTATQQPIALASAFQPNSGMAGSNQAYAQPNQSGISHSMGGYQGFTQAPYFSSNNSKIAPFSPNLALRAAVDDMHLRRQPVREEAARYRRRSIHTIDMGDQADAQLRSMVPQGYRQDLVAQEHEHPLRSSPILSNRPASSPSRSGSSEAIPSARGNQTQPPSTAKRDSSVLIAQTNPALSAPVATEQAHMKYDQPTLVNIPPRSSSSDAAKRITNPSPLSKPMMMSTEAPVSKDSFASTVSAALQAPSRATYAQVVQGTRPQSPAAKQLAALNEKEGKKTKSSRLRRAFSFGSAAELRKVTEGNDVTKVNSGDGTDRARLRKERYQDEREAEQARIAQQQEEAGIGQSIYSGQGNIFSGSTDNLSISSTASSASIMIRKMGQGMKRSTRSLVGLFRPKSVVGVPPAPSTIPQPSQAQVSMINVEAERERVNVNANPQDQAGGGTGFPKLERNSVDAAASASTTSHERTSSSDSAPVRKSIIGGERERAEVLAAVKKGILKRSATDSPNASPTVRPVDNRTPNFNLPIIPHVNDSPSSSAPSTPNDDPHGHKRTNSITIGGEDYFMSALKFRGDSKSVPNTPPSGVKRNATFSPRIQFHDTWPSGEYDRRGEIATCNRLTPMLAQQIKEELNTFKMEMEVHENSKIYTHFF